MHKFSRKVLEAALAATLCAGPAQFVMADTTSVLKRTTTTLQGDINITDGTVLELDQSSIGTYSGVISGDGAVQINGGGNVGTIIFTGMNTYTGGTTISGGTLSVATDTNLGNTSGTVTFDGGTLLTTGGIATKRAISLDNGGGTINTGFNAVTLSGNIDGVGSLTKQGLGVLTLAGTSNTYSGGTTVGAGILQGTTSTLQGNAQIDAGALIKFNQTSSGTYSGDMTGLGAVEINAAGNKVTFAGTNSYRGGTNVISGGLQGSTSSVQGNINVANGANVTFDQSSTGTFSGIISGQGSVDINSSGSTGTVIFTGANAYTGGTNVRGGTLQGTTSSLARNINIDSGAKVNFDQSVAGTYTGVISGNGSVQINGAGGNGLVALSSTNTYSGGTKLSGGTLSVASDNNLGHSSGGLVFDGGTLLANNNLTSGRTITLDEKGGAINTDFNTVILSGKITGTGGLTKQGAGVLLIAGTSNNYSGGTNVSEGTLQGTASTLQGNMAVAEGAKIAINQSTNGTFSGVISGEGALQVNGAGGRGTLTLAGINTYTGGTIVSGGALHGTTSSLHGDISLERGTNLSFIQADTGTFRGDISGAGSVAVNSTGTVIFEGTNKYIGGTSVLGGKLQGTTSSLQGNINIANDAVVGFNQSSTGTFAGIISGDGSVDINGTGNVTFASANTYKGGTFLSGGALSIGSNSNLGDAKSGLIFNGGALQLSNDLSLDRAITLKSGGGTIDTGVNTVNLVSNIGGEGALNKTGKGTLILSNNENSYSGGTIVSGGTLQGTTATLRGNIVDNATVNFKQAGTGNYDGTISGDGNVLINGGGKINFTGVNSYHGGTQIQENSILQGTTSSLQGSISVEEGSSVNFAQSASGFYDGSIYGGGFVDVNGGGVVNFTGINCYTGGTNIASGTTLQGNSSSLQGKINLSDGATIAFDQKTNGTFNGKLYGSGSSFLKKGEGALEIATNNSDFKGTTSVFEGLLAVNSQLGGNVTVQKSGSLAGLGEILGDVHVGSGGRVSPGTPGRALTVNGNYVQGSGSVYEVKVNEAGQTSQLNVQGKAKIENDASVYVTAVNGRASANQNQKILNAEGGLEGTFTSVSAANPIIDPKLAYDASGVYLGYNVSYKNVAQNTNQNAVAGQLDNAYVGAPAPEVSGVLLQFLNVSAAEAQNGLEQLSGQQYAAPLMAAELANQNLIRQIYNPLRPILTADPCCVDECCCEPSLTTWAETNTGRYFFEGKHDARGFRIRDFGVSIGAQAQLNRCWTLGTAFSYEMNKVHYNVGGSGKAHTFLGALYGAYRPSTFYVMGDLILGYSSDKVKRFIDIGDVHVDPHGKPKVFQGTVYFEAGKDLRCQCLLIQPFIGVEAGYFRQNGIHEHGGSVLDLDIHRRSYGSARSYLGFHLTTDKLPCNINLAIDGSWQCRLTTVNNKIRARFNEFGDSFSVRGVEWQRNIFEGSIYMSKDFCDRWSAYTSLEGQIGSRVSSYSYTVGIKTEW